MIKTNCTSCGVENLSTSRYCSRCGYELPKKKEPETDSIEQPVSPAQKRKANQVILGVTFALVVMLLVQYFFFRVPTYEKVMMQAASELNENCPIMVDAETRFDNAIALPGNVFQYNYTLVNIEKEAVDTFEMRNYLEPIIVNNIKTNPQMKVQREYRTTINYYYKDKTGKYLLVISVPPDKYEL